MNAAKAFIITVSLILLFGLAASSTTAKSSATATATLDNITSANATSTPIAGSIPGPQVNWKVALPRGLDVETGPVASGDLIYVASSSYLHALRVASGEQVWQRSLPSYEITDPVLAGGMVLIGSEDRNSATFGNPHPQTIYALDARTGDQVWSFSTNEDQVTAPVVVDSMVYIGAGHEPDATGRGPAPGGSIYGLSLLTGKLQWTLPVPGEDILTTPTAGGAVLYFVGGDFFQEMYIHAVDLKTQQEKWKLKLPDLIYETGFAPVVVGNFVYVAGHRGLYAVDARTGSLMWDFTTGSIQASRLDTSACCNDEGKTGYGTNGEDYSIRATNVFTSFYRPTAQVRTAPVVSDGVIYFAVNVDTDAPVAPGYSNEIDFYLLGLDARTGQERWRYRSETELIEGPVVTTDTIYVGSMHHYVEAIDIKTKLVQWRFYPDDFLSGDLVRAENTLYFGDNNSNVYALLTTPLGMPTAGDPNRIAPFMAMPAMAVTLALISLILGIILSVHKRLKDQRHASVGRSSRRV